MATPLLPVPALLEARLHLALASVVDPAIELPPARVMSASDVRFGDYQTNIAMLLAKPLRANPRQLAEKILAAIDVAEFCEPPTLAGAGFINFTLRPEFIAARLSALAVDEKLGVPAPEKARKFVLDFSSPNVAKPMHVGHIRSTFLGESLARIAEFIGHETVRDNHIGDWGTQFGMLLVGWKTLLNREALAADPIAELERLYKTINAQTKDDPTVQEAARAELVKLQDGDAENLAVWQEMIRLSQVQFETIYARLGVRFDVTLGESFYNPWLKETVASLQSCGIARESDGAICVFSDHTVPEKEDPFLIQRDGAWVDIPALVQKADGAANYTTTDLATMQYRLREFAPDEIVIITDGRQQHHFRQLFAIFRRWQPAAAVKLAHVWFGAILGEDGKPFKTRSGDTVKLADLLDEAEERALKVVSEKNPELPETERREIARIVGLGAVRYADLLPNRQSDYTFSWEKMLSFHGNTAPYLQYSAVRIRSIFRKAAELGVETSNPNSKIQISKSEELALAKKLFAFGEILPLVLEDYRPNLLANYLYELASTFHSFFEACPVLKSEGDLRASRLLLCALTGRVLTRGLGLLGIEVPERM